MNYRYVITPAGQPDYRFAGQAEGFTLYKDHALLYVSKEIAKLAAAIIQERMRKDFPRSRSLVVLPVPTFEP